MTVPLPVHPFPARMAPELALRRLPRSIDSRLTVLDPMMGSGTIPIVAALQGYRAIGFDTDPLAVTISRAAGRPLAASRVAREAQRVAEAARARAAEPFEHVDPETQAFIDRWFDPDSQSRLGALATAIGAASEECSDVLWCAFSRLIITKDAGASRARDVSHSRPHVVRDRASFNPIERYVAATEAVIRRHRQTAPTRPPGRLLRLARGDARQLPIASDSIDLVMTSPPYLQAIDYLRGHRLSLVWMGYTVSELRTLRGESVGSERGVEPSEAHRRIIAASTEGELTDRGTRIVARYIADLEKILGEIRRVLKAKGRATLVIADCRLRGAAISIRDLTIAAANAAGLDCVEQEVRRIPSASRYLPPPTDGGPGMLDKRMKTEHCLTFRPDAADTASL